MDDQVASGANGRLRSRTVIKCNERHTRQNTSNSHSPDKQKNHIHKKKSLSRESIHLLCPYCDKTFTLKQSLSKHINRFHLRPSTANENFVIECLFCHHTNTNALNILKHMTVNHPTQYFACPDCQKRFTSSAELSNHKLQYCKKKATKSEIIYRNKLRRRRNPTPNSIQDEPDDKVENQVTYPISCELKPTEIEDADIENNITTNVIIPQSKLDTHVFNNGEDILKKNNINKLPNFPFHNNSETDQFLSRLGVVHRSPRNGEYVKRDVLDTGSKFEKCFNKVFFSKVTHNIQENLTKFLDGSIKINHNGENIGIKRKFKKCASNTVEGFPVLLATEQCSRDDFSYNTRRLIAPKHKWKWDNGECDKLLLSGNIKRDTHSDMCIITAMSKLDIWTQLRMRQRFDIKFPSTNIKKNEKNNILDEELRIILESKEIPNPSSYVVHKHNETVSPFNNDIPAFLGLMPSRPTHDLKSAVLSGEWARPRTYVCSACGEKAEDSKALTSHILFKHPNAQVEHYEIVGEHLLHADILEHLYVPTSQIPNRNRPLRGTRDCTKCRKSISLDVLHEHMLECAGDTPVVRRKCRPRPFGVRRRRTRLPDNTIRKQMRNEMRPTTNKKKHMLPRTKRTDVGDGDTIRKMLADLPAKRRRLPMNSLLIHKRNELSRNKLRLRQRLSDNKARKELLRKDSKQNSKNGEIKKVLFTTRALQPKPLRPPIRRNPSRRSVKEEIKDCHDSINNSENVSKTTPTDSETPPIDIVETGGPPNNCGGDQLSMHNNPDRINLNNSAHNGKQHSKQEESGRSNNHDPWKPGSNDHSKNDNSKNSTPNKVPLKHSIEKITENLHTNRPSRYGQPGDLTDQPYITNFTQREHLMSVGRQPLFENEAVVIKVDKPPISNQHPKHDPYTLQSKIKPNKPRKGLNDCIAMLKNKLHEPISNEHELNIIIPDAAAQINSETRRNARAHELVPPDMPINTSIGPTAILPVNTVTPRRREFYMSNEPLRYSVDSFAHQNPVLFTSSWCPATASTYSVPASPIFKKKGKFKKPNTPNRPKPFDISQRVAYPSYGYNINMPFDIISPNVNNTYASNNYSGRGVNSTGSSDSAAQSATVTFATSNPTAIMPIYMPSSSNPVRNVTHEETKTAFSGMKGLQETFPYVRREPASVISTTVFSSILTTFISSVSGIPINAMCNTTDSSAHMPIAAPSLNLPVQIAGGPVMVEGPISPSILNMPKYYEFPEDIPSSEQYIPLHIIESLCRDYLMSIPSDMLEYTNDMYVPYAISYSDTDDIDVETVDPPQEDVEIGPIDLSVKNFQPEDQYDDNGTLDLSFKRSNNDPYDSNYESEEEANDSPLYEDFVLDLTDKSGRNNMETDENILDLKTNRDHPNMETEHNDPVAVGPIYPPYDPFYNYEAGGPYEYVKFEQQDDIDEKYPNHVRKDERDILGNLPVHMPQLVPHTVKEFNYVEDVFVDPMTGRKLEMAPLFCELPTVQPSQLVNIGDQKYLIDPLSISTGNITGRSNIEIKPVPNFYNNFIDLTGSNETTKKYEPASEVPPIRPTYETMHRPTEQFRKPNEQTASLRAVRIKSLNDKNKYVNTNRGLFALKNISSQPDVAKLTHEEIYNVNRTGLQQTDISRTGFAKNYPFGNSTFIPRPFKFNNNVANLDETPHNTVNNNAIGLPKTINEGEGNPEVNKSNSYANIAVHNIYPDIAPHTKSSNELTDFDRLLLNDKIFEQNCQSVTPTTKQSHGTSVKMSKSPISENNDDEDPEDNVSLAVIVKNRQDQSQKNKSDNDEVLMERTRKRTTKNNKKDKTYKKSKTQADVDVNILPVEIKDDNPGNANGESYLTPVKQSAKPLQLLELNNTSELGGIALNEQPKYTTNTKEKPVRSRKSASKKNNCIETEISATVNPEDETSEQKQNHTNCDIKKQNKSKICFKFSEMENDLVDKNEPTKENSPQHLRRSQRRKSTYFDGDNSENPAATVLNERVMESRTPLTKKQLIFSKLLLDEENNAKYNSQNMNNNAAEIKAFAVKPFDGTRNDTLAKQSDNSDITQKCTKRKQSPVNVQSKKKKSEDSLENFENIDFIEENDYHLSVGKFNKMKICQKKLEKMSNEKISEQNNTSTNVAVITTNMEIDQNQESNLAKVIITTDSAKHNELNINHNTTDTNLEKQQIDCEPKKTKEPINDSGNGDDPSFNNNPYKLEAIKYTTTPKRKMATDMQQPSTSGYNYQCRNSDERLSKRFSLHGAFTSTIVKRTIDTDSEDSLDMPVRKYMKDNKNESQHINDSGINISLIEKYSKDKEKEINDSMSTETSNDLNNSGNLTDEQIKSEQFMESFGFFSERKPRRSNLLATKKISETFNKVNESDEVFFAKNKQDNKPPNKLSGPKSKITVVPTYKLIEPTSKLATTSKPASPPLKIDETMYNLDVKPSDALLLTPKVVELSSEHTNNKIKSGKRKDEKTGLGLRSKSKSKNRKKKHRHHPNRPVCELCQKQFKRDDNLCSHLFTLSNVSKLLETELKNMKQPVLDVSNPILLYNKVFDNLKRTFMNVESDKPLDKSIKIELPSLTDIIEEINKLKYLKEEELQCPNEEKLTRRDLSCDEALFIDCCEMLKESHKSINSETLKNSSANQFFSCDEPGVPYKSDNRSDGDVDSITAKTILESDEVRNLENELLSGFKEASVSGLQLGQINYGASTSCANASDPYNIDNEDLTPELERTKKRKARKQLKVKPELQNIDNTDGIIEVFEDKFDKIKRKCRSQAAAANREERSMQPVLVEKVKRIKSNKRKRSTKQSKNKKSSKKLSPGIVLTKGALKGFEGVKVSIPTTDIDISSIVSTQPKRQKKDRKKKRKSHSKISKMVESHSNNYSYKQQEVSESVKDKQPKQIDVYEFMDNEETETLEFRTATRLQHFKSLKQPLDSTSKVDHLFVKQAANSSGTDQSDGDDFVYMSDVSADESENSLLTSSDDGSDSDNNNYSKKYSKDTAAGKNAAMEKIFKNNAVRDTENRDISPIGLSPEPTNDKSNLDELFDSLLVNEPNNLLSDQSTIENYSKKPDTMPSKRETSLSKSSLVQKYPEPSFSKLSTSLSKPSTSVLKPSSSLSKPSTLPSKPGTSLLKPGTSLLKPGTCLLKPGTSLLKPGTSLLKPSSSLSKPSTSLSKPSTSLSKPTSSLSKASNSISKPSTFVPKPSTSLSEPSTAISSRSISLLKPNSWPTEIKQELENHDGVARQRARRKCAVGKQNVLAESWSSESEADTSRPSSANAAVSGRKKKSKKNTNQHFVRRNRHISFRPSKGKVNMPVKTSDSSDRASPYRWPSSDEESAPGEPRVVQHGWIVGDSHKKLVTMLAHAKGRKRNKND